MRNEKKNILFLMKVYEIGGQEVVTSVLADTFVKHGHNVVIASFKKPNESMVARTNKNVRFYTIGNYKYSKDNILKLQKILKENNIEVVINQWGLPFVPIRIIKKARIGLNVKVISVYHNQVNMNARIMAINQSLQNCRNPFVKYILQIKRSLIKFVTSRSMRYVYNHSDIYEVLSPSFIDLFKNFTGIENPTKLVVQTNPITLESNTSSLNSMNETPKEKEIIYVGRLDFVQKQVYRVIDTWDYLEDKFPDWRLTIVGDGEDRENLEKRVKCLGLKHVSFEGFQKPLKYYKRASILLLTSDFEGFGLVIVEGMSYGVVPFVYGSYPAVYDIIDNEKNGIILPKMGKGYEAELMSEKIAEIIKCPNKLKQLSENAISKSSFFSLENIYNQWNENLTKINSGGVNLDGSKFTYTFKKKEIIYVGRLDFVQKRVYRVIDTWNYLEDKFPDWRLTIVGDGEDRENLENHVKCLGLKRVSFEGFQKPIEYYKRASILLLTSDFEGFPLVLAECMSFGVIPAVYDSYSAVGDIIDDGKNGIVIPYSKDGYKADEAADLIALVMSDDAKREKMAFAAKEKSRAYSVERIYMEWEKVLNKVCYI